MSVITHCSFSLLNYEFSGFSGKKKLFLENYSNRCAIKQIHVERIIIGLLKRLTLTQLHQREKLIFH